MTPTQNHQKKTTTIFEHINRADVIKKKPNAEWKDLWYQKQKETTHKIDRQSG